LDRVAGGAGRAGGHDVPGIDAWARSGAGGYLGAMGFALLESNFAIAGAFILSFSVLLAGLLLATDYLLLKLAAKTTVVGGAGLVKLGRAGQRVASHRRANDLEPLQEEQDESEEGADEEAEWEEEDEAEEYEEEEEEDDEEVELTIKTPASKAEAAALAEPEAAADEVDKDAGGGDAPARTESDEAAAMRIKNNRGKEPKRTERDEMIDQLEAANSQGVEDFQYELPPLDLLLPPDDVSYEEHEKEVRKKAKTLEKTFKNFGFNVKVVEIETGPVIAQ
jgi:S-DNA-T family DNA segregation ATPase FtsK/SpoIIIE